MNLRKYLSEGRKARVPSTCARLSFGFWKEYGTPEAKIGNIQPHKNLWDALDDATDKAQEFEETFSYFKSSVGVEGSTRPEKIKSVNRAFEKMAPKYGVEQPIPLDLLGGKLIFTSLSALYEALEFIPEHFAIRFFEDRFIFMTPSGYRDVKLSIEFNGLLAEIKFMHKTIDEIDRYEHKVYEILRTVDVKGRTGQEPTFAESTVINELQSATMRMYSKAWDNILGGEDKL